MRSRVSIFIVGLLAALAAALPPAASAPPNYGALGDSYTAGPFIPIWIPPWGCLKSDHNYPHLAAPRINLTLRDPSCSGAETEDMTQSQGVSPEPNPPEFDSLDAETQVVTLGIGGNDIGFFSLPPGRLHSPPHTGAPRQ